ncbi:MAG: Panacea domain-containing protein [Chloroflexi bacterium]|nr:Panacea domain-containing protein [Chloroflexota bacterium]
MLVSDLIRYILLRVREEEGNLGKTKLIKLLYLVDVEYYRRYEKTLTGLQWRFHHYGPYAAELEPLLKRLPDLEEDEVTTSKGHRAKTYTTSTNLDQLEEKIDFSVRAHVDTIIKQWALDDLHSCNCFFGTTRLSLCTMRSGGRS